MSWKKVKTVLLGKSLRSKDLEGEKLGRFWGVSIMASDAVSSVAYAVEEMLMVLAPVLGVSAVHYLGYAAAPIVLLFVVLAFSYSQIIAGYPNGGGAYVVSAENIGKKTSLVAAAALLIDYVLTVAVSLSAATAALTSAFPQLAPMRVPVALLFLCFIMLLNLRGMRESSKVFGVPTYAFMVIMLSLIITGFVRLAAGNVEPIQYPADAQKAAMDSAGAVSILLLLKAFSAGCSALTGVEVVSNAVPSFKEPSQRNAKQVLFILVTIITVIFGGTILLTISLGAIPLEDKTVISQLGLAVFGEGPMFYVLQFATSLILLLAANTAYNGLPTLLALLAEDGYMPRQFMHRGTRLSFSNGILFMTVSAAILLIIFQAETHHLIPLYAVGVFLSFTLSQVGMVIRWRRLKTKGYRHKLLINGLGALMTGTGTVIVFLTKFSGGSWILAIAIPLLAYLMYRIERHYEYVGRQLAIGNFMSRYRSSTSQNENLCLVLVSSMNRSALKTLNYANLISRNVVAVNIAIDEAAGVKLKEQWDATDIDIPLVVLDSPYRELVEPIEAYIKNREQDMEPGKMITVLMPRYMESHRAANILHNQSTYYLERKLRTHRNVATVLVPYIYIPEAKVKAKPPRD